MLFKSNKLYYCILENSFNKKWELHQICTNKYEHDFGYD